MNERRTEGKGGKTVFPRGKVVEGWVNKRGDVRKLIYRHTEHRIPSKPSLWYSSHPSLGAPAFWRSAAPHNIVAPKRWGREINLVPASSNPSVRNSSTPFSLSLLLTSARTTATHTAECLSSFETTQPRTLLLHLYTVDPYFLCFSFFIRFPRKGKSRMEIFDERSR